MYLRPIKKEELSKKCDYVELLIDDNLSNYYYYMIKGYLYNEQFGFVKLYFEYRIDNLRPKLRIVRTDRFFEEFSFSFDFPLEIFQKYMLKFFEYHINNVKGKNKDKINKQDFILDFYNEVMTYVAKEYPNSKERFTHFMLRK